MKIYNNTNITYSAIEAKCSGRFRKENDTVYRYSIYF